MSRRTSSAFAVLTCSLALFGCSVSDSVSADEVLRRSKDRYMAMISLSEAVNLFPDNFTWNQLMKISLLRTAMIPVEGSITMSGRQHVDLRNEVAHTDGEFSLNVAGTYFDASTLIPEARAASVRQSSTNSQYASDWSNRTDFNVQAAEYDAGQILPTRSQQTSGSKGTPVNLDLKFRIATLADAVYITVNSFTASVKDLFEYSSSDEVTNRPFSVSYDQVNEKLNEGSTEDEQGDIRDALRSENYLNRDTKSLHETIKNMSLWKARGFVATDDESLYRVSIESDDENIEESLNALIDLLEARNSPLSNMNANGVAENISAREDLRRFLNEDFNGFIGIIDIDKTDYSIRGFQFDILDEQKMARYIVAMNVHETGVDVSLSDVKNPRQNIRFASDGNEFSLKSEGKKVFDGTYADKNLDMMLYSDGKEEMSVRLVFDELTPLSISATGNISFSSMPLKVDITRLDVSSDTSFVQNSVNVEASVQYSGTDIAQVTYESQKAASEDMSVIAPDSALPLFENRELFESELQRMMTEFSQSMQRVTEAKQQIPKKYQNASYAVQATGGVQQQNGVNQEVRFGQ